ncbi:MAG: hypothetical protein WBG36_13980 [Ornithinimicrobium sp.]
MSRYKVPTAAQVQEVLLKVPTFQLRKAFYEGLRNPQWVRPLFDAGAFSTPPEPEQTTDGYIRDVYWPELSYLMRVAADAPADVVDVLLSLRESNNAWVRRSAFEIGAKIPAAETARLKPLFEAWAMAGFGWRTDPRDQVSCAIVLLEGGETKVGRWLANYLFTPAPSKGDDPFLRKPELMLDEYWYQEELPRLVPALGVDALNAVTGWLTRYAKFSGWAEDGHDFSGRIRPSIRSREESHPSTEDSLVDALRDLAVPAMLKDPNEATDVLLRPRVQLLRKAAMFVVAEAIRQRRAADLDARHLLSAAERLLADEASDDENLRVEYAELAQAVATVDPGPLQVINGFIARAYAEDLKWIRNSLVDEGVPSAEVVVQATESADLYKHRLLSAIGEDALPPQLRTELAELEATNGAIDEALTPHGMTLAWDGPNPFSSQEEMASMSPTELVGHLASWHDTVDGWGPGPSHEGQGRELAGLLTINPLALAGVSDMVQQLRPTYLRAILRGWEAALKADLALDWTQVADLIRVVLAHVDESSFPVEGGSFDDDEDFRGAKSAAVGLLQELVKKRDSLPIPEESLALFANLLIEDADDETAWADYDGYEAGEGGWDPLTMSLNWQWPERLRGLIRLATRTSDAPWKQSAIAAMERELARQDRHGAGRAVLGESLARLFNDSSDWLRIHVDEFFGSRKGLSVGQQITLTTAIATHRYHCDLYDILSGPMIAAIGLEGELARGWRSESDPVQRIGKWAIDALIYGHKTAKDPLVQAFFTTASADVRGDALSSTAWSFFRAEKVDDAIRDRFAALWDERLQHVRDHPEDHKELKGFYWCAKGGKFDVEWWLPRLQEALEIEPAIAAERLMIGKELAQASLVDPATALAVLKLLLEARDEGGMVSFDLTRHAVPVVIANAMSTDDPGLKVAAEVYMNELGAKGNLQLEAEVKAVREGRIRFSDVVD